MVDLKAERAKAGMTQEQLARECGVVRQAICNIECGLALPSIKTAKAIGKVLDLDWTSFYDEKVILNDGSEKE